ncbi:cartilage intermediate layer protein 2 [Carettochelys insculpta]|uniref:cartilage intermediate layer protein 2 n=1 Tax=Carettochelys insculpta TaxID=44489 RepID=UPI003EBED399
MGLATPALLLFAAASLALAREPLKEESRPGKTNALGKRGKQRPDQTRPRLGAAGATEWSSWFNVDHPGGEGDYESLEAVRFYYPARVCARPVSIQARTTEWQLPEDVGELVHYSPEKGFWCLNREQPGGKTCSNYHVRFLCPAGASWGEWSAWSPCSKSCGSGGKRVRHRSCKKSKRSRCVGRPLEVQKCARTPCPACQLSCAPGAAGKGCNGCTCPDHTLVGTILSADGAALANARVALKAKPQAVLARSDHRGHFSIQGVCAGSGASVSVQLEPFAPGEAPIISNGSSSSWVQVTLQRPEKPYMLQHPESKVRVTGQRVTLCCTASGSPMPTKYYWYHNGTLLDRKVHKYNSSLVLRDLQLPQAGFYHCKASTDVGSAKSAPAFLSVIVKGQTGCKAEPEEYLIQLPHECLREAGRSPYYNVGRCPDARCAGSPGKELQCRDRVGRCCRVRRLEVRQIPCAGGLLPVMAVAECGCERCTQPKILVHGRVTAADNGEPLRFGQIFLGKEKIGFTGYQGTFAIEVPPGAQRLVVRFVDQLQAFVDTVKVLPFDPRGGAVYQDIKVMRKKKPVDLDPTQANTILLGELEGQAPIGEMVIPAGSFLRPNREVYNGTVKASVTFLDPRDVTTAAAASSDLNFINAEGDLSPLRTYGMFSVDFRASESNEVLWTGRVEVRVDAEQVRMPEHLHKMKLWSLNPDTGLWEEEGAFRQATERRGKREERAFLIGNVEIRERRLFNLDVPESRRCFVKVRAYVNEKFNPSEQLEGVVITLINLEPQPGYPSNPRAWGRFDSVITGPNGACLPAFCDGQRANAYTAYITATMGGEELEAVPSGPKLNPNAVGVSQPYLNKLGYRRTDHDDPSLKKTAFQVNLAKPNPNNLEEANGPIYPYRSLQECEAAPVSANHFRFYRVEVDKYEYNVVPFKESDLASWAGDYLSWWPNPQEFRACYIKVRIDGPQEYMVRARSMGGSHPRTRGQLYGLRDTRSVRDTEIHNSSAACVEFKCSGMLFDQRLMDRTLVSIVPQGSCRRTAVNSLLREYLGRHPPGLENNDTSVFTMLAPVDPLGHNYGIYTVTDQNPRLAKEIAIGRCFDGTSDGFSREMKSDVGTALSFHCQEKPVTRQSLFQRLLTSPGSALTEIRREMGGNEQLRAPSRVVAYPTGLRDGSSAPARRTPSSWRRMGLTRARQ